jgi:hypothetical protein
MRAYPDWHLIWLWFWFFIGAFMYWLKRAYYGINPPNPVANDYHHYVQRAWAPLMIRFFADSMFFWALFTPGFADSALAYLGWAHGAAAMAMVTKFAVFSGAFGFVVDSGMDSALSKIPWIKDVLPQMPGPLAANVNITDQKLVEAKQNVDAAAENLKAVSTPSEGGK